MKWLLKKLTGIAVLNFTFLLLVINFIPSPKPRIIPNAAPTVNVSTGSAQAVLSLTPAPVRNVFAELPSHNTKGNCWIGYRGRVYNITAVFGTHPGGDGTMLPYCGKDATSGFDTKEKTPAMPHSAGAVSLLAKYLVQ